MESPKEIISFSEDVGASVIFAFSTYVATCMYLYIYEYIYIYIYEYSFLVMLLCGPLALISHGFTYDISSADRKQDRRPVFNSTWLSKCAESDPLNGRNEAQRDGVYATIMSRVLSGINFVFPLGGILTGLFISFFPPRHVYFV